MWGDISHLQMPLAVAEVLRHHGWEVTFVSQTSHDPALSTRGHRLVPLPPLAPGLGFELLSHLQKANRITERTGGSTSAYRSSARRLSDIVLVDAVRSRREFFLGLLRELRAQLLIWDPTELASATAASDLGVAHAPLSFLVRGAPTGEDWWCRFCSRWDDAIEMTRPARVLSFVPEAMAGGPWSIPQQPLAFAARDQLFGAEIPKPGRFDVAVMLSTAYRHPVSDVVNLVQSVGVEGLRVVVILGRMAPNREEIERRLRLPGVTLVDRAPFAEVADRSDLVLSCAGIGTTLTALQAGVPVLALPTRVHSYWEALPLERLAAGRVCAWDGIDWTTLTESTRAAIEDRELAAGAAAAASELATAPSLEASVDTLVNDLAG